MHLLTLLIVKKLLCKLIKTGVKGKLLKVINSLYLNDRSCININGYISEYFPNNVGLLQGEVLSSILFSLFIKLF